MIEPKIFLRTDQLTRKGEGTVYLRILIKREKKDFSLQIICKPENWNFKKCH